MKRLLPLLMATTAMVACGRDEDRSASAPKGPPEAAPANVHAGHRAANADRPAAEADGHAGHDGARPGPEAHAAHRPSATATGDAHSAHAAPAGRPGGAHAGHRAAGGRSAPAGSASTRLAADAHAGHRMPAQRPGEADPHAGHAPPPDAVPHAAPAPSAQADPHVGHAAPAVPVQADPHAGHAVPAVPAQVDPHTGHAVPAVPAQVDSHAAHAAPAAPAQADPHAGHAAPAVPVQADAHGGHAMPTQPDTGDPHAGHAAPASSSAVDPHAGHALSPDRPPAPPVAPAPAEASSGPVHAADTVFGAGEMSAARDALRMTHGAHRFHKFAVDQLEVALGDGADGYAWEDAQFWYGGDIDRLWVKSEGEGEFDGGFERGDVQALWSHAIDPWFDLQAGVRVNFGPGPERPHLAVGVQGLAPYWFEIDAAAFLSSSGDVTGRIEAEHDVRLTQRLILQPRLELEWALQDVPELAIGSGLSSADAGLRLRYQIVPEFAPYVGIAYERSFGDSARFARAAGDDPSRLNLLVGVRIWF